MTMAAMMIAAMKTSARRSYRVAILRQSLSLANMFSTLWRCLYCVLQNAAGELRRLRGGIQALMPFAFKAWRY